MPQISYNHNHQRPQFTKPWGATTTTFWGLLWTWFVPAVHSQRTLRASRWCATNMTSEVCLDEFIHLASDLDDALGRVRWPHGIWLPQWPVRFRHSCCVASPVEVRLICCTDLCVCTGGFLSSTCEQVDPLALSDTTSTSSGSCNSFNTQTWAANRLFGTYILHPMQILLVLMVSANLTRPCWL